MRAPCAGVARKSCPLLAYGADPLFLRALVSSLSLMAQCQYQDAVDVGQMSVERQIAGSSTRNHQLALAKVDFAANFGMLHQNLQRLKNQNGGVLCSAFGLLGLPPFTRAIT